MRLLVFVLLLIPALAQAATVYQCADAGGHTTFTDSPCAPTASATTLNISPAPYIGSVSTYAFDQRTVNQALRDSTRQSLTNAIDLREQAISNWRDAMAADLTRLTSAQANTPDTIPGAIHAQQLAIEKQTVVNQYTARIQSNERAIADLQAQLTHN